MTKLYSYCGPTQNHGDDGIHFKSLQLFPDVTEILMMFVEALMTITMTFIHGLK